MRSWKCVPMSVLPSTSSKFLVKSSLVHIESQSPTRSMGWLVNPHSYPIPHWSGSFVGIIKLDDFWRWKFGGFLTGFRRGVIEGDRDSFTVWTFRVCSNFTFSSDLKKFQWCWASIFSRDRGGPSESRGHRKVEEDFLVPPALALSVGCRQKINRTWIKPWIKFLVEFLILLNLIL